MKLKIWIGMLVVFTAMTSVQAQTQSPEIPMVGIDEDGTTVETSMDETTYTSQLESLIVSISDSVLPAIQSRSIHSKWMLRTVMVGIGAGIEAGIGPILKVKLSPRFRLAFSNSTDPVLP